MTYTITFYKQPGGVVGGVYSKIFNYSPWVQPNSFAYAVSNLGTADGTTGSARAGWIEGSGGVRNTMVEWLNAGVWNTFYYNAQPLGAYTYYTVLFDDPSNKLTFQVAGATLKTATIGWTPDVARVYPRITTLATQMPGGSSAREHFDDSHVWYSGSWHAMDASLNTYNTTYFFGSTGGSLVNYFTYDKACLT